MKLTYKMLHSMEIRSYAVYQVMVLCLHFADNKRFCGWSLKSKPTNHWFETVFNIGKSQGV
jgi:hypothetical protein